MYISLQPNISSASENYVTACQYAEPQCSNRNDSRGRGATGSVKDLREYLQTNREYRHVPNSLLYNSKQVFSAMWPSVPRRLAADRINWGNQKRSDFSARNHRESRWMAKSDRLNGSDAMRGRRIGKWRRLRMYSSRFCAPCPQYVTFFYILAALRLAKF